MSQDDFFAQIGVEPPGSADSPPPTRRDRKRRTKERKRRRRRRRIVTTLIMVLVLAGVGIGGYWAYKHRPPAPTAAASDYSGAGEGAVEVEIPDGASGQEIGKILYDKGVVASVGAFADAYAANANSGNIQAGVYTLKAKMSAANAVAALLDPASQTRRLTIPEGFTQAQVKEKLISTGGFTDAQVDAAFADAAGIGLPAAAGGHVEGWLAPDTYNISQGATATEVVAEMVKRTVSRLKNAGVAEADYETVLIKASIVEREATPTYYGQVARVIDNRLADTDGDTQGKLGMDSTILYGLGRSGGMPTQAELDDASNPYNTRVHPGLPPTPIGSPGKETITAVLNPPAGDWLYFVTINLDTGETRFASTYAEQQANEQLLQQYCATNEAKCSSGTHKS